jgi:hypothetical protein
VPSRKQRRRREKLKRHEYEYVLETEEGEEIVLEGPQGVERTKDGRTEPRAKASREPVDRRGRPVPKPSLRRVLKRTAIFAPLIAIFVYVTSGEEATVTGVLVTVVTLLAFFMPFSYAVDVFVYRMLMRRQQREREAKRG